MNFNIYDILSNLIPGVIVFIVICFTFSFDSKSVDILIVTALAYSVGYFVNSIGGWLEKILFWTWGGEPAMKMLESNGYGRIKFYETESLKTLINNEIGYSKAGIFQISMRLSYYDDKVIDMNASYIFSRSIFASLIVSYFILISIYFYNPIFHIISISLIFLAWQRSKERAFYYVRQVYMSAINAKTK